MIQPANAQIRTVRLGYFKKGRSDYRGVLVAIEFRDKDGHVILQAGNFEYNYFCRFH